MSRWLRRRGAALALGGLVALTLCLPAFLMSRYRSFQFRHYPDFARGWPLNGGFSPLGYLDGIGGSVDEHVYAARSREAAEHLLPGDPYLPSNRSPALLTTDTLSFMAVGLVYRLAGDIHLTWTACRLLFGFLWFYLLYLFLDDALGKDSRLPLFGAAFLTLYCDLFFAFPETRPAAFLKHSLRVLFWLLGNDVGTLGPTRIISRAVTFVPFWLAGVLAARNAGKRSLGYAAGTGLALGSLMYVHLDVGSTALGAAGLFAVSLAWLRRRSREAWVACGVAAVAGLPWVLSHFPSDPDMLERVKAVSSRAPSWSSLLYLAGMCLAVRRARADEGERSTAVLWCGALLGSAFACLNIQLLTGAYVYPIYWQYVGNLALALLGLLSLPARWAALPAWNHAVLACLLVAFGRATTYAALHYPFAALPRDVEDAIAWLDGNAPPGSVVATLSPSVTTLLPSLSRVKPLAANLHPIVSDLPRAENARRLGYAARLYGLPLDRFLAEAFDCGRMERAQERYRELQWQHAAEPDLAEEATYVSAFFHGTSCPRAREIMLQTGAEGEYPVDYLWVGPLERRLAGPAPALPSVEVYRNPSVTLLRVERRRRSGN